MATLLHRLGRGARQGEVLVGDGGQDDVIVGESLAKLHLAKRRIAGVERRVVALGEMGFMI